MKSELSITLEQIRRREPDAIAALVRLHHRQLRGYVAAISVNVGMVDDLAQEVFVRALERLDRVVDLEDFGRFLRGIARNVVREQARWHARYLDRYVAFVEELHQRSEAESDPLWSADPNLLDGLQRCVEKLPDRSKRLLRLRYWEEKPAEDIGREVGLSGGAVRIALLRIRELLSACLRSTLGGVPEVQS